MRKEFTPLELNEENVQTLLSACRKEEEGHPHWDIPALLENRRAVRYLLGQLDLLRQGSESHPVDPQFCRRYDGKNWTERPERVMDLLSLGLQAGALEMQGKDHSIRFPAELRQTLSPTDPDFAAWYEGERSAWQEVPKAAPQAPQHCGENLKRLLAAAQAGDAEAQYRCGAMFYGGEETDADPAQALYWLEQAAQQGHADAQCNCGTFYYNGIGTEADPTQALCWYEKAAQQGSCAAQFNCGLLYSEGKGTLPDPARALYWYEKAAEQGHVDAQCDCGTMYFNGQGTARDLDKAKAWFEKAAAQGDEFASQVLAEQFQ